MQTRLASKILGVLLVSALSLGSTFLSSAAADTAGTVHFLGAADSSFDQFTSDPAPGMQEWFNSHMWRMVTYSPYFDSRTSWYHNGWVYDDSYAIYRGDRLAAEHPNWILRDSSGDPLYIPSGCNNGSCPQYAGDISNPEFRRHWIDVLESEIAHGYRGVFIDDVNMEMQVSNSAEQTVAPIDPSTGKPMSDDAWRGYMAQFMQEVRTQLPNIEIAHNAIWFADEHAGISNPSIRAEIESANYIFLERGVNDSGLTGGSGSWSVNALLFFVDQVHSLGRNVVLDGAASDPQGLAYNLASYFLVSNGSDAVRGNSQTPESWWSGWSKNLGEASGPRYLWNHLLRRDFSGGMALVNSPGEPTETVSLSVPMQDAEGNRVTSVTLPPASGAILTTIGSASGALSGASATEESTGSSLLPATPAEPAPTRNATSPLSSSGPAEADPQEAPAAPARVAQRRGHGSSKKSVVRARARGRASRRQRAHASRFGRHRHLSALRIARRRQGSKLRVDRR